VEKRTVKRVKAPQKVANKQKNKIILGILAFFVVGSCALAAYSLSIKGIVKEWDNKIYPGVTVQGVDIGGMTKEQAKDKLTETFNTNIGNKKLSIAIGDKPYELIYSDIIPQYDADGAIRKLINMEKKMGFLRNIDL